LIHLGHDVFDPLSPRPRQQDASPPRHALGEIAIT
jgi:hypothetical protein